VDKREKKEKEGHHHHPQHQHQHPHLTKNLLVVVLLFKNIRSFLFERLVLIKWNSGGAAVIYIRRRKKKS